MEQLVRPGLQQIAEQYRPGETEVGGVTPPALALVEARELSVHRRTTSPSVGPVDDIVMDQRGGVKEFKGGGDIQRSILGLPKRQCEVELGDRAVPEDRELRSQPFAAREEGARFVEQGGDVGAEVFQLRRVRI